MSDTKKKKVTYKSVVVTKSEVTEKRTEKSKYNKFQLYVARLLNLVLAEQHQYLFRIAYKGTSRLKVNDIVTTPEGVIFVVVKSNNGLAMVVSKDHYPQKPTLRGKLTIIQNLKDGNKNTKTKG